MPHRSGPSWLAHNIRSEGSTSNAMETSDDRAAAQWVDDRFAGVVVPSDQQPDPRRVFDRILARHEQRRRRRRTLLYAGCSAIAVLLVIGALPSTRLVAQRVWK